MPPSLANGFIVSKKFVFGDGFSPVKDSLIPEYSKAPPSGPPIKAPIGPPDVNPLKAPPRIGAKNCNPTPPRRGPRAPNTDPKNPFDSTG